MTGKKALIFILTSIFYMGLNAHSGKAKYHAVIETDGGLDDMRAISLLLASAETEVIGIYCTDGILNPLQTATNVKDLLGTYRHEGIPVGYADAFLTPSPTHRDLLEKVSWGMAMQGRAPENQENFLHNIYHTEQEKITYICLGSLRAVITELCPNDWMLQKTEQILWFNEEKENGEGFNHRIFQDNCQQISDRGLDFIQVSPSNGNMPLLDDAFWMQAKGIDSRYAAWLSEIHNSPLVSEKLKTGREHIWDELVAIYLYKPELFFPEKSKSIPGHSVYRPSEPGTLIPVYLDMMKEGSPGYKIFSQLPLDPAYYQQDITPYIDAISKRYGEQEWRAGVLCFELHGHIGIYAIIGVKMGLRAREYFNIGLDDLRIESHAGLTPPISCLNDGLQVSTGSSLGHGLISATDNGSAEVSAIFNFKGTRIMISLKEEIAGRMKDDIKDCIDKHGKLTPSYWDAIRALGLEYWLELDKNQIFAITKIS